MRRGDPLADGWAVGHLEDGDKPSEFALAALSWAVSRATQQPKFPHPSRRSASDWVPTSR